MWRDRRSPSMRRVASTVLNRYGGSHASRRRASLTARTVRVTIAEHEGRRHAKRSRCERYDFFLSRRGSVAAIAQEVADVLD
jgi:hypothetical protein